MTEPEAIKETIAILIDQDFKVEEIPRLNNAKRPDLMATQGDEIYLIEQKTKGDNPQEIQEEHNKFKDDKIYDRAKPLQPRSVISKILSHALEQIEDHPDADKAFKVIWMTTTGVWKEANYECLFKGVYGSQLVFDADNHDGTMKHCYYLGFSDFERCSQIDAVIVCDGSTLRVLVNELSPRYESFKTSSLAKAFKEGIHDPKEVVLKDEAHSLKGFDGDKLNQEECLDELAKRLDTDRMLVMKMNEFQVIANLNNYTNQ